MTAKLCTVSILAFTAMLLAACASEAAVSPTATPIALPLTATPTALPPTATPTPSPTATRTPRPTNAPPSGVLASKAEDVVGVWKSTFQIVKVAFMHFRPDGTYDLTKTPDSAEGTPHVTGNFWFEGTELYVRDNGCTGPGIYEVWVLKEGDQPVQLTLMKIRDACRERAGDWEEPMLWVEP